jgi:hypothetical protein
MLVRIAAVITLVVAGFETFARVLTFRLNWLRAFIVRGFEKHTRVLRSAAGRRTARFCRSMVLAFNRFFYNFPQSSGCIWQTAKYECVKGT